MTKKVEYIISLNDKNSTEFDGDGEITFEYDCCDYGDGYIEFTVDELKEIVRLAEKHHNAYQAYKDSDYNDAVYWEYSWGDCHHNPTEIYMTENGAQATI